MEHQRVICKVCLRQYARYTCPRCNIGYCSLPCYKQHGEGCTESFYREQAVGELQGQQADGEQRRQMLEILQRVHGQQVEDEAEQQQLMEALLQGMSLGEAGLGGEEAEEGEEEGGEGEDEDEHEEGEEEEELVGGLAAKLGTLAGVLSAATLERLLRKAAVHGQDEEWEVEEGDLSPEEWRAFQRAVALGKIGDAAGGDGGGPAGAAAEWLPWWETDTAKELSLGATGQRLVVEVGAPSSSARAGSVAVSDGSDKGSGGGAPPSGATQRPGTGAGTAAAQPGQASASPRGGAAGGSSGGLPGGLPEPPEAPLPPLSALTRASPSPLLRWHLVEVLFAYCYTLRRCRGAWGSDPGVSAAVLLALTDVLAPPAAAARSSSTAARDSAAGRTGVAAGRGGGRGAGGRRVGGGAGGAGDDEGEEEGASAARLPETAAQACLHVAERATSPPVGTSKDRAYVTAVLYDVAALLGVGRPCVLLALTDAHRLVRAAAAGAEAGAGGAGAAGAGAAAAAHAGAEAGAVLAGGPRTGAAADRARGAAAGAVAGGRGGGGAAPARPGSGLSKAQRRQLAAAERKLHFLLVWANQLEPEAYAGVCAEVTAEWQQQHEYVVAGGRAPGQVQLR